MADSYRVGQTVKYGKGTASVVRYGRGETPVEVTTVQTAVANDPTFDLRIEDTESPKGYRFETNVAVDEVKELSEKEQAKVDEEAASITINPEANTVPTPAKANAERKAAESTTRTTSPHSSRTTTGAAAKKAAKK